jgi:gamma-glutamylaminecyclotransferase
VEIFVYGTLMSGERNHFVLEGARFLRRARTLPLYELVDSGEYPAMLSGGTTAVDGEIFDVAETQLPALDRFEETPHLYQRLRIELDDGTFAESYLYVAGRLVNFPRLPGGTWKLRR